MFETMKRMIADAKIRKTTMSYEGRQTTYGVSDVDINGFKKAIGYAIDCGVHVIDGGDITYKGINIIIDDNIKGVENPSLLTLKMSRDTFVGMYRKMKTLGMSGIYVLKAVADAIGNMPDDEYTNLINNISKDVISEYVDCLLRSVGMSNVEMTKSDISMLLWKFGEYKGLREVASDALKDLANDQKFRKNRCLDCIHCCYDNAGNRYCDTLWRTVPQNMGAVEIAKMYVTVKPSKRTDNLISQYLPFEIPECEFHVSRR